MSNVDIRNQIREAGFTNWRVAEKIGVSESHFSRMLRHELSDQAKEDIKTAILKMQKERGE